MDRFGTGLALPLRRENGRFVTVSGPEKVMQCVEQIIGTPIGKLPWRGRFGCRIPRLRHMNNRMLNGLARVDVADALQRWEPRFLLHGVQTAPGAEAARNRIDLTVYGEVGGVVQDPIRRSI